MTVLQQSQHGCHMHTVMVCTPRATWSSIQHSSWASSSLGAHAHNPRHTAWLSLRSASLLCCRSVGPAAAVPHTDSSHRSSSNSHQPSQPASSTTAGQLAHTKQQQSLTPSRSSNARTKLMGTSPAGTPPASTSSSTSTTLTGSPAQPQAGVPRFSLEPRSWVQQAAEVTEGLLDASKYKSLAVYAEVRLAEALDKAAQACPNSIAGAAPEDCDEGQPLPNPLGTAVCCQVRGLL